METRKRIFGRQYELARIYAPKKEGEYILSKRLELKTGKGREVYEEVREMDRQSVYGRKEMDFSYLRYLFFSLQTETPIMLRRLGEGMHKPTDEIEHEVQPWKERMCTEISLRVMLQDYQVPVVERMMGIVQQKMRSFKTDFLFHDMKVMARLLGERPMLWVVGDSHTFTEVLWPERDADDWVAYSGEERRREFLNGSDDTWMGAALRVSVGRDDLLYYIDAAGSLHKVDRELFESIHKRHVDRVRMEIREKLELNKAA